MNPLKAMEEKREKTQPMANSAAFSDEIPNMNMSMSMSFPFSTTTIFDMMPPSFTDQKASSFGGFMDLLAVQDYNPFLFDCLPTTTTDHHPLPSPADGSEVLNTPASPNSSSISSSSNEAAATTNNNNENPSGKAGDEHEAEDEDGDGVRGDDQDQDKIKKQ